MADLTKILGVLMATKMASGSSKFGAVAAATPVLFGKGTPGGGMSLGQKAGIAALAYLAYRAYNSGQTAPSAPPPKSGGMFGSLSEKIGIGGSTAQPSTGFADRLTGSLRPTPQIESSKALLLIRSMVAAAYVDGHVSPDERHTILGRLDQAGAGPEERRLLEHELANPCSMDAIVREVRDPDTAAEVYLASNLAITVDTDAERAYLAYLATRLNLTPVQRQELDAVLKP